MNIEWSNIAVQAISGLVLIGMNYQILRDLVRRVGLLELNKNNQEGHDKDVQALKAFHDKDIEIIELRQKLEFKNLDDKCNSIIRDTGHQFRNLRMVLQLPEEKQS